MAGSKTAKGQSVLKMSRFSGMNNRLSDGEVLRPRAGGRTKVRDAVNVDFTDGGSLRRREGYERVVEGSDVHSLWSCRKGTFFVDSGSLKRFPNTTIFQGLSPRSRVSFTEYAGEVFFSDGVSVRKVREDGSVTLSGVPAPNPVPTAHAASGGLAEGDYLVSFAAVGAAGELSPTTWASKVRLPSGGGIRTSGISGPTNVYVSATNGDQMYLAGVFAQDITIRTAPAQREQPQTQGMVALPAGHILRSFRGRLLSAVGNTLVYSEPFAPALHNPGRGFIPFPERITLVEPVETGVYVCADKTYFLAGEDIEEATLRTIAPHSAVEGTSARTEDGNGVMWYSEKGLVMADEEVANLQEEDIAVQGGSLGATLIRDLNGISQALATVSNPETASGAAASFMEAELIRKEQ